MEKKLQAEHAASHGNIGPMIAFVNSSKGRVTNTKAMHPKRMNWKSGLSLTQS